MSLLLPKELVVELSPGECRINTAKLSESLQFEVDAGDPIASSLHFLESQLIELAKKHRSVAIHLSDSFGVVQVLPWQENLSKQIEIERYARICLEGSGTASYADWSLHADFLRHRENGIVYGFPNGLITKIRDLCSAHGIALKRLIPKSAYFFFQAKPNRKNKLWLACTVESRRISSMIYQHGKLVAIDVEPIVTTLHDALLRQIVRLIIRYETPQLLRMNCSTNVDLKALADFFKAQFPSVELQMTNQIQKN